MVRVEGDRACLELAVVELGPPGTPGDGDLLVRVSVDARGFAGRNESWITGPEWSAFVQQARELERSRQGSAVVRGASPDDLMIELHSTDRAGHMAVRGVVRRRQSDGFTSALDFGFPFEPDQLPELVAGLAALAANGHDGAVAGGR